MQLLFYLALMFRETFWSKKSAVTTWHFPYAPLAVWMRKPWLTLISIGIVVCNPCTAFYTAFFFSNLLELLKGSACCAQDQSSSTMLPGILDFTLLGTGGSQAPTPWLVLCLVTRWRFWLAWVQMDKDCLWVNFLFHLFSYSGSKEVF